jgi:integrase
MTAAASYAAFPSRFRFGPGPRQRLDVWARDEDEAKARAARMRVFIAALWKAGRGAAALELARDAAEARLMRDFAAIERAALTAAALPVGDAPAAAVTYREVVRRHLSGELHQRRPKDVPSKTERGAKQCHGVYAGHIFGFSLGARGAFGDQPIALLTIKDALAVKEAIGADYSDGTYKIICSLIRRPFVLAEMFGWIERSPIPIKFVPPPGSSRIGTYLYPDEDSAYLGCRKHPLCDRVAVGFGARNGTRPGEAENAVVGDVDFKRGIFTLDKNKTKSPRQWKLEPDSLRALRLIVPAGAKPTDKLFPGFSATINGARRFREQIAETPGCDRRELFANTDERRPICLHHAMRATFVTNALAASGTPEGMHRTDTWVRDRTGHTTDKELEGYRKNARMVAEHEPRWLDPLDQAIPELRKLGALRKHRVNAASVHTPVARAVHDGPPVARRPLAGVGQRVGQRRVLKPEKALGASPSWSEQGSPKESPMPVRARKTRGAPAPAGPETPPGPPLEGVVGQAPTPQAALAAYLAALTAAGDLDTAAAVLEAARRRRAPPPDNVASLDDARAKKR